MSVDIDPLELNFRRPFTQEVSQILTIKNPHPHPVAFKVKTTAPKQYCVRPNAGRIEPGQDFDVTVLLQAMKVEPAPDAKCRDKFLVQSVPITGDKEFASISSVFETTEKSAVSERKIRVNWLAPSSDDSNGGAAAEVRTPHKPAAAANGSFADTPEASRTFSSPEASRDTSSPSQEPPPYTEEKSEPAALDTAKSVVSDAASTVTAAATSVKEKAQQELRQRKVSSGATTTTPKKPAAPLAQAIPPTVQGVSVQITALLCFLSFLIAYLFF